MEEWRFYNNFLKVSNTGRFIRVYKTKEIEIFGEVINGYIRIHVKDGDEKVKKMAHCIVWETFVGKIPSGMQIDHINTIRSDNRLDNLRLVTPKENANNPLTKKHLSDYWKGKPQPIAVEAMKKSRMKSVKCISESGLVICIYNSLKEASEKTGINFQNISSCCLGNRKTAGGYIWRFEN